MTHAEVRAIAEEGREAWAAWGAARGVVEGLRKALELLESEPETAKETIKGLIEEGEALIGGPEDAERKE